MNFDDAFDLARILGYVGLSLLPLGYPDRALRQAQEGLALMQHPDHQFGISGGLGLVSSIRAMRGEWQKLLQLGKKQREASTIHNFSLNRTFAELHMGVAMALLG